jgi:hypothetical protein
MDDTRKKVAIFTVKLTSQSLLPLWTLAHEYAVYSIALGEKTEWGPRTRILRRLIQWFNKINAADAVLFAAGLCRALFIWCKVRFKLAKPEKRFAFKKVFAGFGAVPEEHLYKDFVRKNANSSVRVNVATYKDLHKIGCPSLFSILSLLIQHSFGYSAKLRKAIPEISRNAEDFLTICAVNIGIYSFYRPYWKMAREAGIDEVTFLAADTPAFACVDEGLKSIFFQHGLLCLSILFPKVSLMEIMTLEEENYLKRALKDISVHRQENKVREEGGRNNILVVLWPHRYTDSYIHEASPLIKWAIGAGFRLVIRPTPMASEKDIIILRTKLPDFSIDDPATPFDVSISRLSPKFIAAWTSTCLATALDYGSLPISFCNSSEKNRAWNMIYPMRNRAFFWPRDRCAIEDALLSDVIYREKVDLLRAYEDTPFEMAGMAV